MSGDRLAQFQENIDESDGLVVVIGAGFAQHVLDVAKAARLIQAFDQAGGNDWWEAHAKLYAALARLDSGAAEEDA